MVVSGCGSLYASGSMHIPYGLMLEADLFLGREEKVRTGLACCQTDRFGVGEHH